MKKSKTIISGIFASIGLLFLILDGKAAFTGARDGIALCLFTVIPSLFPFLILSLIINSVLIGKKIKILQPLCKLCGIPAGGESLLLLGLLGGYPVGAQSITDAYNKQYINKATAHRLLGFCNNAGPAFIFGILSTQFPSPMIAWAIWLIHILSALAVGSLLPDKCNEACNLLSVKPVTLTESLEQSIRILGKICGWVVLFRVILSVLSRWLFWLFPVWLQVIITGLFELANGCVELCMIPVCGLRLIIAVSILSFGGLCVGMQTASVTKELGTGFYFPGKVLQTIISVILAVLLQLVLFPIAEQCTVSPILLIILMCVGAYIVFSWHKRKKVVAFPSEIMYNIENMC